MMGNGEKPIQAKPVVIAWHPGLSIYASERFLKIVGDEYGWLGGIDDKGELRCVLPYTIVRKAMLRMVRFRIETIPLTGELEFAEERSFLNEAVEYFRSTGAHIIIPQSTNAIFRTYPDGALAAPYGSYVVDLCKDEDALFSQMSATHRNKVRRAKKNGVKIRCGPEYMEEAHRIIKRTLERSSLRFMAFDAFRRFVEGLGDNAKLVVAEHKGSVQACTLFPFSCYGAYSLYSGSAEDMVSGAMNLLNWEAMNLFRSLGVQRYDFVGVRLDPEPGSKQEGLMKFKQHFGGELKKGYIWKYPFSRSVYWAYSIAARVLRKGDIVDQEEHKLKNHGESQEM